MSKNKKNNCIIQINGTKTVITSTNNTYQEAVNFT